MQRSSIIRACAHCSREFHVYPSQTRDGRGVFCSRSCANAGRTARHLATFWDKVQKSDDLFACWPWLGNLGSEGYGQVWVRNQPCGAHRVAWELTYGPIPDGLWVLHDCPGGDNPACVRPDHLWLGTAADNNADAARKGRTARGDKHGTRRHPELLLRGDAWRTSHPSENIPRGERAWQRRRPELLRRGEACAFAVLTETQVKEIRHLREQGLRLREIADRYGVTAANVCEIVNRKTWKHVE